jgi:hypothetical protein
MLTYLGYISRSNKGHNLCRINEKSITNYQCDDYDDSSNYKLILSYQYIFFLRVNDTGSISIVHYHFLVKIN